jgi:hypothetical protein
MVAMLKPYEQGQELDINLITCCNDLGQFFNLQDLVIILSFLFFGEDEFDFFASGIVSAGPTRAILLDYDGLARTL